MTLIDDRFSVDTKHMNTKARTLFPVIKLNAWLFFYLLAKLK